MKIKISKISFQKFRLIWGQRLKPIGQRLINFINIRIKKISQKVSSNRQRSIILRWLKIIVTLYILIWIVLGAVVYTKKSGAQKIQSYLAIFPVPSAIVNGSFTTAKAAYSQLSYVQKFSQQTGQQVEAPDTILNQIIDQQIEDRLVTQQLSRLGGYITKKDINDAFNKIADQNGGQQEVTKVLTSLYGMDIGQFKDLIATQLRKDKLQEIGIQRVKVHHILVADEAQAKTIISDIQANKKSFEDEAKDNSKDSNTKDKGGDLGSISRGVMPQAFDDVAFNKAEIGKIYSDPIKTDFGYHIIRVDERTGSIKMPYDQWLADAKKKAKIIRFLK